MTELQKRIRTCLLLSVAVGSFGPGVCGADWSIAARGNAFRAIPDTSQQTSRRDGTLKLQHPNDEFAFYFHVNQPADLQLALRARTLGDDSAVQLQVAGDVRQASIAGREFDVHGAGSISVSEPGYVQVRIRRAADAAACEVRDLVVSSTASDLTLTFVKNNDGNMFYWGRRGPSVHLTYDVPRVTPLKYAYSEITVPAGQDVIGSYFMANGFAEGYFGIQVNSASERRVLFSVWSPYRTDDPASIPADQRIEPLAKGPGVRIGEFGNEGSGGQSRLVYPWQADTTYRFLTEVVPDGQGNTVYTCWFGSTAGGNWRLIASFRRPKTDTHLRGFHSFLENFNPEYGHIERRVRYSNVWVGDVDGQWTECTGARFSVDATGRNRHRLDFIGGSDGDAFYLRNCGFFNETSQPGTTFTRSTTRDRQPDINFAALPRS